MNLPYNFMNGDEDLTEEIINTMLQIGIKEATLGRVSVLMISQLYVSFMSRRENPFIIADEISCLEGNKLRGESRTKPPTMFNRKPYLRGLWHKHYHGSGIDVMARNLQVALKNYGLPKFEAKVEEAMQSGEDRYFTAEDAALIAHEAVMEHWERRAGEQKMTGHWIIYAIYEGKNYYLSLGRHTDDEAELRRQIETTCLYQFPFLSEILCPLTE
ncbi:hypothetical protein [Serratia marcescens]|uniref:hypothetical protein n=1 Tax=Serratia marcescens TaxID=615 RepID=UPI001D7AB414|nr:hypothetical protein [Serratia marcescens]CAF2554956.1 hypothetical protein AI2857V1_3427 [Serratia marcescens]CAH5397928.1 hypothetical protein AI2857V1_3427 [Serratia marcescens]